MTPAHTRHLAGAPGHLGCSVPCPRRGTLHPPGAGPESFVSSHVTCSLEGAGELGLFQRRVLSRWQKQRGLETHSGSFPSCGGWGSLMVNKLLSSREEHGGLIGRWGSHETVGRCHWVEGMLGLQTSPQEALHQQTCSLCLLLGRRPSPGNPGILCFLWAPGSVSRPKFALGIRGYGQRDRLGAERTLLVCGLRNGWG